MHYFRTFGESNLLRGSARNFTAIAASEVEVLTIASVDFNKLLDKYPGVRDVVATKINNGAHDLFELKVWKRFEKMYDLKSRKHQKLLIKSLKRRTEKVKKLLATREILSMDETDYIKRKPNILSRCFKKCISSGRRDYYLPFLYFAKGNK